MKGGGVGKNVHIGRILSKFCQFCPLTSLKIEGKGIKISHSNKGNEYIIKLAENYPWFDLLGLSLPRNSKLELFVSA